MRLTFLGTSAGMPTVERNVTALCLAQDDSRSWYLIDCGEGTQQRLLKCRYTLAHLEAIFITHKHGDHMFGLPGLITSACMQGRTTPLTICAPEGIEQFLTHALEYAAVTDLPFELQFMRSDRPDFIYRDETFTVSSHALSHRVPSFAYRFNEAVKPGALNIDKLEELGLPRGPLWGQLQSGAAVTLNSGELIRPEQVVLPETPGRVAVVAGDNDQPDLLHNALFGSDILVHEATFTEEELKKVGPKYMHSSARRVAAAAESAGIEHLILTHFSGRYRTHPKENEAGVELLRQEAQAVYQGQVELAEDYSCWEITRERTLKRVTSP